MLPLIPITKVTTVESWDQAANAVRARGSHGAKLRVNRAKIGVFIPETGEFIAVPDEYPTKFRQFKAWIKEKSDLIRQASLNWDQEST